MNTVMLSYTEDNAFVRNMLKTLESSEYFTLSEVKSGNFNQNENIWKDIPEEFRCDPYAISPSGDPYWADKRNVEEIERRMEEIRSGKAELIELSPEYRKKLFAL